jgi:hypothetical protein
MKKPNIKDPVWIHIGERTLTQGRVVEIIDLEHLEEGHSPDNELYVVELKTGIEDIYEVRTLDMISPDAQGPINVYRKDSYVVENRLLKKIGMPLPQGAVDPDYDLEEPTPEQIHAAMERAEQAQTTIFQPVADAKPKRNFKPKRKPYNRRKKNDA